MQGLEVNEVVDWGPAIRPTRANIDLQAVVANSRRLSELAHSPVLAVVKADAYGHGAVSVARALEAARSVAGFAVSLVEEGIELRAAGITSSILVMGPSLMDSHDLMVEHELMPMISDERHLAPLARAAGKRTRVLDLHLKIDTGMGRLGLHEGSLGDVLSQIESAKNLRLVGVASHLACADEDEASDAQCMTHEQLRRFAGIVATCRKRVAPEVRYHVANSAGILRFEAARYDLARPGLALYGNGAGPGVGLRQAISLRSQVTQLRHVTTGARVSYGATWTAKRDSVLAIVPIGYADGLPRNISGKGHALIGGARMAIVGTVSMDMIVVDVTDLPAAAIGDEVVLLGSQGAESISVAQLAKQAGVSEYELTCGISKRVPRTYDERLH